MPVYANVTSDPITISCYNKSHMYMSVSDLSGAFVCMQMWWKESKVKIVRRELRVFLCSNEPLNKHPTLIYHYSSLYQDLDHLCNWLQNYTKKTNCWKIKSSRQFQLCVLSFVYLEVFLDKCCIFLFLPLLLPLSFYPPPQTHISLYLANSGNSIEIQNLSPLRKLQRILSTMTSECT